MAETSPNWPDLDWSREIKILAARARRIYWWIDPEEIKSIACLAVARAAAEYKPDRGARLRTWIFSRGLWILRNELRRCRLLRRPSDQPRVIPEAKQGGESGADGLPAWSLDDLPGQPEVADPHLPSIYLVGLLPAERALVRLRFLAGWSLVRIGRLLGCSSTTVLYRLRRVLALIRRQLERRARTRAARQRPRSGR